MERRTFLILAAGALLTGCGKPKKAVTKPKSGEKALCEKCGQIKGSDLCCKAGAEKCEKCGMHKGSPGCCAVKEPAKTPAKTPAKAPK